MSDEMLVDGLKRGYDDFSVGIGVASLTTATPLPVVSVGSFTYLVERARQILDPLRVLL